MTQTTKNHAEKAAKAHTTLCTFDSIVGILERNNISGISAQRTAAKIEKLCRDEQRRQLQIYDREIANVG